MTLLLLLYAECTDEAMAARQAQALCAALQQQLPGCRPELAAAPARYWKIAEYFSFDLRIHEAGTQAYQHLLTTFRGDWWRCEDEDSLEAVWNAGTGPALLLEEARWAQLILPLASRQD